MEKNIIMSPQLAEKLFNVMKDATALEKSMTVGKGNYQYQAVPEKQVLNMAKPLYLKYRLIIKPTDAKLTEEVTFHDGKMRAVTQVKKYYDIIDVDTGEGTRVVGIGNGADTQDKGAGKASTYSYKDALCKTHMMFSGDDTDNIHSDDIDRTPIKKAVVQNWPQTLITIENIYDEKGVDFDQALKDIKYTIESINLVRDEDEKAKIMEALRKPFKKETK